MSEDDRLLVDVYPHLKTMPPKPPCPNGCDHFVNGLDLHLGPPYEWQCWGCLLRFFQNADGTVINEFIAPDQPGETAGNAEEVERGG